VHAVTRIDFSTALDQQSDDPRGVAVRRSMKWSRPIPWLLEIGRHPKVQQERDDVGAVVLGCGHQRTRIVQIVRMLGDHRLRSRAVET
jgi:hypothetical protein